MRDLRSPVFFACRWRRDFDRSDVWLGERKTRRAVTGKTAKIEICP